MSTLGCTILKTLTKKALIIVTPFSVSIISLLVATFLTYNYSSPIDEDWVTRQFLIGMFMVAGVAIIPRLLHFQLFFSGMIPSCVINLSHHPPSLRANHEFQIGTHSICSGCFGNFFSIILAELIFLMYFLNPKLFPKSFTMFFFLIGLILILVSYSRYLIFLRPSIRLIQHVTLFMGVAIAVIASDLTFNSAFCVIILLPSWVLFLVSRVILGELDHVAVKRLKIT